ncbi:MAG: FeoB small GTPase domain-containing protein [Candidatus Helarchaeota archaeon]
MSCHKPESDSNKKSKNNNCIIVALIGNPNVGKTVIFNNLTGAKQHVGNWPGVTVEKKEGKCVYNGITMTIVDLPGTYSLTARSIDEVVARDYIIKEKPDVVVDIVDSTNLERNLYLTILLLEVDANLVIALNMWDVVQASGAKIDIDKLSNKLGVPMVPTAGTKELGMKELKDAIIKASKNKGKSKKVKIRYKPEIEVKISKIIALLEQNQISIPNYPLRWVAIKTLEKDIAVLNELKNFKIYNNIMEVLK